LLDLVASTVLPSVIEAQCLVYPLKVWPLLRCFYYTASQGAASEAVKQNVYPLQRRDKVAVDDLWERALDARVVDPDQQPMRTERLCALLLSAHLQLDRMPVFQHGFDREDYDFVIQILYLPQLP